MFRHLNDYNFFNKRVLVRCDFNVDIEKGKVVDDFKIQRAVKTLSFLKESGAKTVIASHLEKDGRRKPSLKPVVPVLEKLLGSKVLFAKSCVGRKTKRLANSLKTGEILLLENLRQKKGETENDRTFSQKLAELAEVYVGEAFSACHRPHASILGAPKCLPHFIGFECEREVQVLNSVLENPERPLAVIVGGSKVGAKLKMIRSFLPLADYLLFGGILANVLLVVKGIQTGGDWPEPEIEKVLREISLTSPKVHLPLDVLVCSNTDETCSSARNTAVGMVRKGEAIFDIGPQTAEKFSDIIRTAKTIFWSGDMGMAENPNFRQGTKAIAIAISQSQATFKVAGGGDTTAFIRAEGLESGFSYLSTGGSALLEFIANGTLPGIEALKI